MKLQKWNYRTKEYEDYIIPNSWDVRTLAEDLNEKINCASCGRVQKIGDMYTSMVIHNRVGFGFMVCSKCNLKEYENRKLYRGD